MADIKPKEDAKGNPLEATIVVVGAGLAGLCCTRRLQREGCNVHLYEATESVGGRLRTDVVDGFRLDRGFQVLMTAFPALRKELDVEQLDLQPFDPGALMIWDGALYPFSDPFRKRKNLIQTAFSGIISPRDKLKLLKLRRLIMGLDLTDVFLLPDCSTADYLTGFGFSLQFIDNFARPVFGGIFLQRGLETSARMFGFIFKMLMEGAAAVPAGGMNAIPRQISGDLAENTLHLARPVVGLLRDRDRVTGIVLADGSEVPADVVVVATPADIAAHLTGIQLPEEKRSATCLYFEIPKAFTASKSVMFFADPNKFAGGNSLVNNATIITNIAPSYAPEGKHLLSVSVIGEPRLTDEQMVSRARREIGSHFKDANAEEWRVIRIYRISWAQFSQPTGIFDRLPTAETDVPGLILSGEIICNSSIQGAMEAGQKAASAVLYAIGKKKKRGRRD
jgi:phytoene dehydrogenase-like protein